ncbi:MAG TPA: TIGR03118 family protein [Pyrinomonadaceae bacterium]
MKTKKSRIVILICTLALAGISLVAFTQIGAYAKPRAAPLQLGQSTGYEQTNLVSNIAGLAPNTDPKLLNPWGFIENADGTFRVAANGSGRGILFSAQGVRDGADIIIPTPAGSAHNSSATPNGVVPNDTSGFVISDHGKSAPATLLFSTEDGTIAGWNPQVNQAHAVIAADQSGNDAIFKLLALGTNAQGTFIFATDFHNGVVDIFDSSFDLVHFGANAFVDPTTGPDAIPSDFAPFGVKNFGGTLFVTYAMQDADREDDVAGVGNGFIDEYDTSGNFIRRFATRGALNSPIGATIAPADFGQFSNDVLIGNFGDSRVNAFDPATGAFLGQLTDTNGDPLVLNGGFQETDTKGLWGIGFGNGVNGAGTNAMFFAAGINEENDGLFGKVTAAGSN